jgi:hypothetical protein
MSNRTNLNELDGIHEIPPHLQKDKGFQLLQKEDVNFFLDIRTGFGDPITPDNPVPLMPPVLAVRANGKLHSFPDHPQVTIHLVAGNPHSFTSTVMQRFLPDALRELALQLEAMRAHGRPPGGEGDTVPIPESLRTKTVPALTDLKSV